MFYNFKVLYTYIILELLEICKKLIKHTIFELNYILIIYF